MQNSTVSPSPESAITSSARLHYLDWLRVLATLAVFIFHVLDVFNTFDFHVKNAEQSEVISVIQAFFFTWGMPFFFLLAGAGSWFSLRRRTTAQYTRERFSRLLLPFIVGSLLLTPIQLYVEWSHGTQTGVIQASFGDFLRSLWTGINPKFFGMVGYHLWFLGFLFAYSLITQPLFRWLNTASGTRLIARLAALCERRGAILLVLLPLALIHFALQPYFPQVYHWTDFFYLLIFYMLGYLLLTDGRFAQVIRRDWSLFLVLGIIATVLAMALALSAESFDFEAAPRTAADLLFWGLVVVNSWCWTLVMLYIGMRYLDFRNRWLDSCKEAVLPFYVFHQPVIVVIAYFIVQWQLGLLPKLLITLIGAFIITLGIYELLIRRFNLLRTLFGMKPRPPNDARPSFPNQDAALRLH